MSREIKVSPPHRSVSKDWDPIEMERYWRPVFDKYDVDKDGTIPLRDLKNALKSGGDLRHDFPDDVIDEIVEWADLNNDGMLNYNEFLRMVHAHELGEARPTFQRIVRFAALAVVPKSQQKIAIRRYIEEYNCFPPPIFLLLITLVELGIYIYYCVEMKEFSATGPVPIHSPLIYNPRRRYEAWRYVTYMFIHAGAVHIFFNLLIQLLLGLPLEMVHKWWRVMLVYLGGVLAGSLGSSLSDPYTYLAGASGGVYALIAAHLANVIINFKEMTFGWIRLFGLLVFGGTDIGVALYTRYTEDEKSRTSYAAHFAGALAGLMIGIVCLRNLQEVESLCKSMYLLNKARLKYESSVDYVTSLMNSDGGNLGMPQPHPRNMYAQGDIGLENFERGTNFGSPYRTEQDKINAINRFFFKIEKIKLKSSVTEKLLAEKIQEREKLKKAAAEKLLKENRELIDSFRPQSF